ncbi:hypothetical protein TH66_21735 [Carbonactinospora thermoautotrophica]|uniref:SRPBCC family protein n=1 Tax=Carbonactinospora thermoautotrophica TaxID=1469144 RepID=A0A132MZ11_9ACTN|nr:SRPBCC family protein [Carbonactinospora thermoautotrophica]KWW97973.1 hypothetical protein TH66_21735 [Carbonactinospora thermoautotrophica]KWX03119.1 hypothetical protein LI90_4169 [Carbonactinospora thermoautotrophica]KWX09123.1 hypothetical protein TR74_11480 [Carbonactinospora thermoautotrophica]
MRTYELTRGMPASAEIVFDVAADLSLMYRWLPPNLHLEQTGPSKVHMSADVESPGGERHLESDSTVRYDRGRRRLEWNAREPTGYGGWLQVRDAGAGTSEVSVHLEFSEEEPEALDARADLEESLRRLEGEVTRRVREAGARED